MKLGLGELHPTPVVLQLIDRSMKIPRGIVEDVLIQLDKFYFPVDFIVIDTQPIQDSRKHILIILGRPFLATADAHIQCRTENMQLSFGNMTTELNIFNIAKKGRPKIMGMCFLESCTGWVLIIMKLTRK